MEGTPSLCGGVLCRLVDDRFATQECVIEESDILILGAPHKAYRGLQLGGKDVVDVWGAMGSGIRL